DDEIEPSVAVVVKEGAARAPSCTALHQTGAARDVLERAVSSVSVQAVLAPIGDEEIVVPVIVVVADAGALAPTARAQPGAFGDILKRPVSPIPVQVIGWLLPLGKTFEHRAVDEKDVEPAVAVVVDRGRAGPRRLEQVLVRAF